MVRRRRGRCAAEIRVSYPRFVGFGLVAQFIVFFYLVGPTFWTYVVLCFGLGFVPFL